MARDATRDGVPKDYRARPVTGAGVGRGSIVEHTLERRGSDGKLQWLVG